MAAAVPEVGRRPRWRLGSGTGLLVVVTTIAATACADDGGELCAEGVESLSALPDVDLDPANQEFDELVDTMQDVDPPEDIAADWDQVVAVFVELRDLEQATPEDIDRLLGEAQGLGEPYARVQAYVADEC